MTLKFFRMTGPVPVGDEEDHELSETLSVDTLGKRCVEHEQTT